jgi:hypothetical protein
MAVQMINVGRLANDGTGDDLREAFIKINQNFQLFEFIDNPQGRNLGSEGAEVFAQIEDGEFQFRRLVPGQNIQINQFDNTIQINGLPSPSTNFQIVGDNSNTLVVVDNIVLRMQGDGSIVTQASENTKTVSFQLTSKITNYLDFDFGEVSSNPTSIFEVVMNSIGVDFGTFTSPSSLNVDQGSFV